MQNSYSSEQRKLIRLHPYTKEEIFSYFYLPEEENGWNPPLSLIQGEDKGLPADAEEEFGLRWRNAELALQCPYASAEDSLRVIDACSARKMAVFAVMKQTLCFERPHIIDFRCMTEKEADRYASDLIGNIITDISRCGGNPFHLPYLIKAGAVNAFIANYIRTADIIFNIAGYDDENVEAV